MRITVTRWGQYGAGQGRHIRSSDMHMLCWMQRSLRGIRACRSGALRRAGALMMACESAACGRSWELWMRSFGYSEAWKAALRNPSNQGPEPGVRLRSLEGMARDGGDAAEWGVPQNSGKSGSRRVATAGDTPDYC